VTSLAVLLAERYRWRVLVVDLDPQADACHILGYTDPDLLCGRCGEAFDIKVEAGRTLAPVGECPAGPGGHVRHANLYDVVCEQDAPMAEAIVEARTDGGREVIPNVFVALASAELAQADLTLSMRIGSDLAVADALDQVAGDYDLVLIDCPPSLGKLMVSILVAGTDVVCCVKPTVKEIRGLTQLERTVSTVNQMLRRGRPELSLAAVLVTDVPGQGRAYKQAADYVRGEYPDQALPTIARSVRVAEAFAAQTPTPLWDRNGPVVRDFNAVIDALASMRIV
jgi:chromosome partitioning protein